MTTETRQALENWLEIGVITSAYGLKGEVKVTSLTDFPERFQTPCQRLMVSPDTKQQQLIQILASRYVEGKNQVIVRLEGIKDRNQAEALRGYKLMVDSSDRPPLEEDEYHISQLITVEVYLQKTGQLIGQVVDVLFAGNDLLEIELISEINSPSSESSKSQKVLIPFVKEIVPLVDLKNNRIEISPPTGLLEL